MFSCSNLTITSFSRSLQGHTIISLQPRRRRPFGTHALVFYPLLPFGVGWGFLAYYARAHRATSPGSRPDSIFRTSSRWRRRLGPTTGSKQAHISSPVTTSVSGGTTMGPTASVSGWRGGLQDTTRPTTEGSSRRNAGKEGGLRVLARGATERRVGALLTGQALVSSSISFPTAIDVESSEIGRVAKSYI